MEEATREKARKHKRRNPSLAPLQERDVRGQRREGLKQGRERVREREKERGRELVQRRGMGNCNEQPDSYK